MPQSPPPGHFQLLYFASAASFTKKDSDDFPAPLPTQELFSLLEEKYAGIKDALLSSCAVTVNLEYIDMDNIQSESPASELGGVIKAGDEVAIIPPVSSG